MTNKNPDAAPSARSLEIAESVEHHWKCNPTYGVPDPCGPRCDRFNTALDIDAAIKSAVDAETERCAREVTTLYKNDDGYGGSEHDRTLHKCELAIRASHAREGNRP